LTKTNIDNNSERIRISEAEEIARPIYGTQKENLTRSKQSNLAENNCRTLRVKKQITTHINLG
jgi:hypothetical protein